MNLRFPEIFGILLFSATACSFGLPRGPSQWVENTFQFVYAPVTGPIQWMTNSSTPPTPKDVPIVTQIGDEVARLRHEKLELQVELERYRGQLETLRFRASQSEKIGEAIRDRVVAVKVIGVDGSGRDLLRLSGASTTLTIGEGAPVIIEGALIGRISGVGSGNQSTARLLTDKGSKILVRFGRYKSTDQAARLEVLPLEETIVEGIGKGEMRIDSLRTPDVKRAGLQVNDLVLLSDTKTQEWPIEVHGYRIGVISYIGERTDTPGVAEVRIRPDVDVLKLRDVWIIGRQP